MREMKKSRYFIAFFLSLCIFVIGILIGVVISGERASYLDQINTGQKLGYDSLQLQTLFLTSALDIEQNCIAASTTLERNIDNLAKAGKELESFLGQVSMNEEQILLIKREYILSQIRYWLLSEKFKNDCSTDTVSVLYFYSDENCWECSAQGLILTYLKDTLKDKFLVFTFDSDFVNEPMVDILKSSYNITISPSLVIEGEKYEGLIEKEEILNIICPFYVENIEICEGYIPEIEIPLNITEENVTQNAM